jgi:hypothetical protein
MWTSGVTGTGVDTTPLPIGMVATDTLGFFALKGMCLGDVGDADRTDDPGDSGTTISSTAVSPLAMTVALLDDRDDPPSCIASPEGILGSADSSSSSSPESTRSMIGGRRLEARKQE